MRRGEATTARGVGPLSVGLVFVAVAAAWCGRRTHAEEGPGWELRSVCAC